MSLDRSSPPWGRRTCAHRLTVRTRFEVKEDWVAVAGIDSHKDTLAVAVVDDQGRELDRCELRSLPGDITGSSGGWGATNRRV